MANSNLKAANAVNGETQGYETVENKTRILVVDGHPIVRHELVQLISRESDLEVCIETESSAQTLDAVKKRQVDVVVVDISLESRTAVQLAERIKLECPTLPVLMLSMQDESSCVDDALKTRPAKHVLTKQATDQVIGAVHYIQSLLESRVFGFTVFVKLAKE
jgi:DNA-binding NarL/FixJ family response regulator